MARKRFIPQPIVSILREPERKTDRQGFFRKHRIWEQPFYRSKRMNSEIGVLEVQCIKALKEEKRNRNSWRGNKRLCMIEPRGGSYKHWGKFNGDEVVGVV